MSWKCSRFVRTLAIALLAGACSDDPKGDGTCQPDDLDGVIGGNATLVLTVTDSEFTPAILTAQNESRVHLTLKNQGAAPRGFVVDCLPTPNDDNCPQESCFPEEAEILPIEPGAAAEVRFEAPSTEGIYRFRSSRDEEEPTAQFVIR